MTTPASYSCLYDASSLYGYNGVFVNDDGLNGLQQNDVPFDAGACSNIMLSSADYNALTTPPITTDPVTVTPSSFTDLWPWTPAQSMDIGVSLTLLLGVGFCWRAVIKSLNPNERSYHENE